MLQNKELMHMQSYRKTEIFKIIYQNLNFHFSVFDVSLWTQCIADTLSGS